MTSLSFHRIAFVAIVAIGVTLLLPPQVTAQQLPPAVIAVVDVQFILQKSTAAASVRTQVDKIRTEYQEQVNVQDQELRKQEQELKRQQSLLTPKAFNAKRRDFQRRVADVQREVQQRLRKLDRMRAQGLKGIEQALRPIIVALSEERGFNVVLASTQLVFAAKTLDITQTVLERLNQTLPTVNLNLPSE